jgi:hypothetical protein
MGDAKGDACDAGRPPLLLALRTEVIGRASGILIS